MEFSVLLYTPNQRSIPSYTSVAGGSPQASQKDSWVLSTTHYVHLLVRNEWNENKLRNNARLWKRLKGLNDHSAGCDGSKPWLQHYCIFAVARYQNSDDFHVLRSWKESSSLITSATSIPACPSTSLSFFDFQPSSLCLRHSEAS